MLCLNRLSSNFLTSGQRNDGVNFQENVKLMPSQICKGGWIASLSLGWLIPNHYQPWPSFYLEAWIALFILLGSARIVLSHQCDREALFEITLVSAGLISLPLIQHCFGLIPLFADAVVSMIYLAGFTFALVLGSRWERLAPLVLPDALFAAFLVAGLLSFVLQLCQWTGIAGMDFLLMGPGYGRPAANLGQPNHLATLLLWSIVATAWLNARGFIGGLLAIFISACLLFGIALTLSRTAWVGLTLLFILLCYWRRLFDGPRVLWLGIGLGGYFLLCLVVVARINPAFSEMTVPTSGIALSNVIGSVDVARLSNELRPSAWMLFIEAILHQPLWGYGWNQGNQVQLQLVGDSALHVSFAHAHNFFLDLVVWSGIPLGILLISILLRWFWRTAKAIKTVEEVLLFSMLILLGNHAMLELPMNYVYFLMPAAMVMGVLNTRLHVPVVVIGLRWVVRLSWVALLTITIVSVRDYSLVEQAERQLRIELAGFKSASPPNLPETWLLNQWREVYRFAYMKPREEIDDRTLKWAINVATYFYSPRAFFQLSTLLALNDRPDEARLWLKRFCNVVSPSECEKNKLIWLMNSEKSDKISMVKWPD